MEFSVSFNDIDKCKPTLNTPVLFILDGNIYNGAYCNNDNTHTPGNVWNSRGLGISIMEEGKVIKYWAYINPKFNEFISKDFYFIGKTDEKVN